VEQLEALGFDKDNDFVSDLSSIADMYKASNEEFMSDLYHMTD
jgi:hypothetical protein